MNRINAKSILLVILYALMLIFTPKIFNVLENDSPGYIGFQDIRTSIYPILIKSLSYFDTEFYFVIYFQIGLYLLALFFLFKTLFVQKFNIFIIISFYFSLLLNIYLNGFHFTILTESLSFSFLLFFLSFLLNYLKDNKNKNLFYCSLFLSLTAFLRPSSFGFVFISLIFIFLISNFYFKNKIQICLKFILLPFLFVFLVENFFYYNKHNSRNSIVTDTHIYGKVIMLEMFNDKNKNLKTLSTQQNDFIIKSKDYLNKLLKNKQYCLFFERIGDFENYTYFNLKQVKTKEPLKLIYKNFDSFLNLTLIHYLNFFCVATPVLKNDKYFITPFIEKDRFGKKYRVLYLHKIFLLLGFSFYLITIILITKAILSLFVKQIKLKKYEIFVTYLIISCHSFMLIISTLSISSPRHLMFIFPVLILLLSTFFINKLLCMINYLKS